MARDYTKIAIALTLIISLFLVLVQIFKFGSRMKDARAEYEEVRAEYEHTRAEKEKLQEEFFFYSNPANLSKELRSRFNYTLPGEKVLIIVPRES